MDRYHSIIDDWDAFRTACERTPLTTVRENPIKARDETGQRIRERFPDAERANWNDNIWRLGRDVSPGKSLLYWRGEYYVQEESAVIPVTVLDPQPGERVLDLCAAPGGKTTQIAARMDDDGVVVANEKRGARMKSLHANVNRCGAASVVTTNYDGRNLPEHEYDRVLVDAPCSGEGNECRRGFTNAAASESERDSLSGIQKGLLEKAAVLLKDGGTLVYSTCTFAPEENEAVVDHALQETELTLLEIDTDVPHQRGVVDWQDQTFPDELERTVRVYPHHLDSGGMYVAAFTR